MYIESLEERRAVQNGQMWLDEHIPHWWMRGQVRLTRFDIASAHTCMLAQATGLTYSDAVSRWRLSADEQARFGFLAPPGSCRDTYYGNLTRYWREEIIRRRKAYTLARAQVKAKQKTATASVADVLAA